MSSSIYDFAPLPLWQMSGRVVRGNTPKAPRPDAAQTEPARFSPDCETAPRIGVIYNPRSHRNRSGPEAEARLKHDLGSNIHIAQPDDRSALPKALSEFAAQEIDLLAIDGGDGTVRDVLTCGHAVFGNNWPALAVLPRGKTNALAHDLDLPSDWELADAAQAYCRGSLVERRPLAMAGGKTGGADSGQAALRVHGFILGAGAFTKATQAGQSAHKLGAFNSMVVASTAMWALIQSLTASRANVWRRGAKMHIGIGPHKAPLGHSGNGNESRRQLLFVSSLENMPAGINPFGAVQKAGPAQFKMVAVDQISRRTTALIPAVLAGYITKDLRSRGIHQLAVSSLSLELDEPFVLDGESFPAGEYTLETGPDLRFVTP